MGVYGTIGYNSQLDSLDYILSSDSFSGKTARCSAVSYRKTFEIDFDFDFGILQCIVRP